MNSKEIGKLAATVAKAREAGFAAAQLLPNDNGTSNLDCVVVDLGKGVRLASLEAAGIDCWKAGPGLFALSGFPWQGARNTAGAQAQASVLSAAGVSCYVRYQMD